MRRIDIIWDNPKRAEDLKGTVRIFEGKCVAGLKCVCTCEIETAAHSYKLVVNVNMSEKTASCVYSLADTYYRGINAQPNVHCWEEL